MAKPKSASDEVEELLRKARSTKERELPTSPPAEPISPKGNNVLFVLSIGILGAALTVLLYDLFETLDPELAADPEPFHHFLALIIFAFPVAMLLGIALNVPTVKAWRQQLTGYQPPPETVEGAKQEASKANFAFGMMFAALIAGCVIFLVPRITLAQGIFSLPCLILVYLGTWIGHHYPEFRERYAGAIIGLLVSVMIIDAIPGANPLLYAFLLAVFAAGGHAVATWWNGQDFVVARRRQEEREKEEQAATLRQKLANEEAKNQSEQYRTASAPGADGISSIAKKVVDEMRRGGC